MLNNSKLQALLAIAPLAMLALFFLLFFGVFFGVMAFLPMTMSGEESQNIENSRALFAFPLLFGLFIFLYLMTVLSSWIFFIIHAAKNPNLDENNLRIIWILLLIFVSGFGPLAYWLIEIRGKNPRPVV